MNISYNYFYFHFPWLRHCMRTHRSIAASAKVKECIGAGCFNTRSDWNAVHEGDEDANQSALQQLVRFLSSSPSSSASFASSPRSPRPPRFRLSSRVQHMFSHDRPGNHETSLCRCRRMPGGVSTYSRLETFASLYEHKIEFLFLEKVICSTWWLCKMQRSIW